MATKAGILIAMLAWRPGLMRGWAYFRVDLGLTDSLFDGTLDAGRMTIARKNLVSAFLLRGLKLKDGMQMLGGEWATDVLVGVPSGAHSKTART